MMDNRLDSHKIAYFFFKAPVITFRDKSSKYKVGKKYFYYSSFEVTKTMPTSIGLKQWSY